VADKQAASVETLRETLKIVEPDEATRKAWADALPNIPKLRADEIDAAGQPGEAIYRYIDALKAVGHAFPRDWSAER
jgi:hypothetical protein